MKKPFENTTNSPMYISGTMVPPGEIVLIDVPDEGPAPAVEAQPTLAEQVALLLKKPVKDISESLGNLNDDTLDMMTALETAADKPRVTLMTALAYERLKRADGKLTSDPL